MPNTTLMPPTLASTSDTNELGRLLVPADQLKRYTNPDNLPPDTLHANAYHKSFGQTRAVKAIETALDIRANGYHIFAVGENGLGKRTIIKDLLTQRAKNEPTPPDLIYVHNFTAPRLPCALSLPTGTGKKLAEDMDKLWTACQKKLIQKFSSLSYQNQLNSLKQALQTGEKNLIDAFNEQARPHNLSLNISSTLGDDSSPHAFCVLDPSIAVNNRAIDRLQKKLVALNHALDQLENTTNARIDELHATLAQKALEPLFKPLIKKYATIIDDHPLLGEHLQNCLNDMIKHAVPIVDEDSRFEGASFGTTPARYSINVLVSHDKNAGAPIVIEELPTHLNLLGHIEYATELGSIYSDVSMIRAGALHRANGGYLLLEAQSLLEQPYAWQGLKRALQSKTIKISSLEQMLTLTGSLSLAPEAVDLSVKVVLLGEPDLYYELLELEPEFNALFKIRADFHDTVPRTKDSEAAMVTKIADIVKSHKLHPFDNTACAAIIDELAVLAQDNARLDLHSDRLCDLVFESHRFGESVAAKTINQTHVKAALSEMIIRKSYLKELYWREIQNGQQLINTTGKAIGQVNALTVIGYADSEFGLPARLTAVIAPKFGSGEILDIERDVELGGSLHAKGMLIMASFLRSLFSTFHPLNFSASIAFEQSYGQIDGDSATLAEGCALLSALADVPIAQYIAVTGSMNQLGQVQAVGGVNAKIAGFFDACVDKGLDGTQGVILPKANLSQLMLRDDIVEAVRAGQFFIYAVEHIKEALSLLSGMAVDDKNKNGEFKKHTLFGKIVKRLSAWEEEHEPKKK